MKIPLVLIFITASLTACATTIPKVNAVPMAMASSMPQSSLSFVVNPAQDLNATLLITPEAGGQVLVQLPNRPMQFLMGINPELYSSQTEHFLRLDDKNKDGYQDIGLLISMDRDGQQHCYEWFLYEPATSSYREQPKYYFCRS